LNRARLAIRALRASGAFTAKTSRGRKQRVRLVATAAVLQRLGSAAAADADTVGIADEAVAAGDGLTLLVIVLLDSDAAAGWSCPVFDDTWTLPVVSRGT
jgi:hypothetical protein